MKPTARLTLPYPPSVNRMWRRYNGLTVTAEDVRAYKKTVAYECRQVGVTLLHGPLTLYLDFYRPQRSGDLSNRIKVVEDALIGIAYTDDSQIVEIHARRFDDKHNPRVEVTISPQEGQEEEQK